MESKKYTPCGGCGATEPDQRCIGCMHPFTEIKPDEPPVTPEWELINRIVSQWGNAVEMPNMEQWLKDYAAKSQPAPRWVKASIDCLPLHRAFWNIEDGFKKNNSFPVRIDGRIYGMGDIYDNRQAGAPDPIYYFVIDGKDYYENEFHRIEWLDEQPAVEENKSFEYFLGELQARTDRILRDKGASSKEVYDAINDVMNELRPIFTFDRHEQPAAGREEERNEFAEWCRMQPNYGFVRGMGWMCSITHEYYTTDFMYELFKQQKEKI